MKKKKIYQADSLKEEVKNNLISPEITFIHQYLPKIELDTPSENFSATVMMQIQLSKQAVQNPIFSAQFYEKWVLRLLIVLAGICLMLYWGKGIFFEKIQASFLNWQLPTIDFSRWGHLNMQISNWHMWGILGLAGLTIVFLDRWIKNLIPKNE